MKRDESSARRISGPSVTIIATIPSIPVATCLVVVAQDYLLLIAAVKTHAHITGHVHRKLALAIRQSYTLWDD
jgi:hypothetical protein